MFLTWSLLLAVLAPAPPEEIDTWVPLVGERGTVTLSEPELLEGEEPQVGDVRIAVSADTPYWAGAMVQGEWVEELVEGAEPGDGLVVRMRTTGAPGSVRVGSMGRIEASGAPGGVRAASLTGSAMVELDTTVLGDQWRRVFLPCRPEHDVPRGLGSGLPARIADAELHATQGFVPVLVLATPGVVLELADWELDPTGIFDAQGYVEPAAWATPSTVDADPLIRKWSELPTRIALGEAGASDLARIREAVDRADDAGLAIRRALREKWAARILEDGGD
ncbi:MAG: hypothetical protein GF320_17710, partial [Armatimonadia bacterium]|nr:hypothetical protein [Armatimonadia bacterium]